MTLFPAWFFTILIYAGILLASAGFITLLVLFLRDMKQKNIW
jgi:hypothetical protein